MAELALFFSIIALAGLLVLTVVLLAVVKGMATSESLGFPTHIDRLQDGESLPSLVGWLPSGEEWSTEDLRGPALLSILSGQCSSCGEAAMQLRAAAGSAPIRPLVLYGEPPEDTTHLDALLEGSLETVRFPKNEMYDRLKINATPMHYVVDSGGAIRGAAIKLASALEMLDELAGQR